MERIMANRRVVITAVILSCLTILTVQCIGQDNAKTTIKSSKKAISPGELLGPDYVRFTEIKRPSLKLGSLQFPEAPDKINAKRKWSNEVLKRGFAVAGRATLPLTHHTYLPTDEELDAPIRLTLSAGEMGSVVVFVRSTGKDLTLRGQPPSLASDKGYGIEDSYGSRYISLRAVEETRRNLGDGLYVVRPEFLTNSSKLFIKANDGGQFWLTVQVPPGTPPGEYKGEMRIGPAANDDMATADQSREFYKNAARFPVILTVRDIELEEPDIAYGTWYHTAPDPQSPRFGPAYVLPGSDEFYLADQRRHGMNTVAAFCKAERKDKDGTFHVTFNELDAMVTNVQRAGLCRRQPMLLCTWRDDGIGGEFGEFAGEEKTVMAIFEHGKKKGWPEILFPVLDEPRGNPERTARIKEVMKSHYEGPRKKGVRTVVASPSPELRDLYDVWIVTTERSDFPQQLALARKHNAEVWIYDCGLTQRNPLLQRFYSGLWTWHTGAQGNMVWSYGYYVRIKETGLPESKVVWEARLAGVNDYRYLQTLEKTIAAAEGRSEAKAAVQGAKAFLEKLHKLIPYTVFGKNHPRYPLGPVWNPIPKISPEDYDRIRGECARHIGTIRALMAD